MKKLILTPLILLPTISHAYLTNEYDQRQLQQNTKCQVATCALDDHGQTFTRVCDEIRQRVVGSSIGHGTFVMQLTQTITAGRKQECYCPCDTSFERLVRTGREW